MGWNLAGLHELLAKQEDYAVSEEDDCLIVTSEDGIESFLTVSGDQIIIESLLFPADGVSDSAALNEQILRTHKIFPLTSVGMVTLEGEDYYAAFGALSSQSKEASVLIELEFLFQNVEGMLEIYEGYLA